MTNPNPYPTLGVDVDIAGYPAQAPTPHHHPGGGQQALSPADIPSGMGAAVGLALEIGKVPHIPSARPRLGWEVSRPITVLGSYIAAAAASTYCFLVFPQTTPNKIWEVMRIGVTAPDPFTTLAGVTCLAFRSSFVPQDSTAEPATFGDLIAVLGAVPNTSYPATRSVLCRGNERVVLAFKGLANAQQLQASMDVVEHDLQAFLLSLQSV
jgi:hypothetical protein